MSANPIPSSLAETAANMRDTWRQDTEEFTQAAKISWTHSRTIADRLVETMHAGVIVEVQVHHGKWVGQIVRVGTDFATIINGSYIIHFRIPARDSPQSSVVCIRLLTSERRRGGTANPRVRESLNSMLYEIESPSSSVMAYTDVAEYSGCLEVSQDHVSVGKPDAVMIPTAALCALVIPHKA